MPRLVSPFAFHIQQNRISQDTAPFIYSKLCLTYSLIRRPKIVFKTYYRLMQVKIIAEHSAIISIFIKLPFVIKMFLSVFEWLLKTGFTVLFCCNS